MKIFNIAEAATTANLTSFLEVYRSSWKLIDVSMDYFLGKDISKFPVKYDKPETWPFKARFIDENGEAVEIRILTIGAGYRGFSSEVFAKILEFLHIPYEEEDIFTLRKKGSDDFVRLRFAPTC